MTTVDPDYISYNPRDNVSYCQIAKVFFSLQGFRIQCISIRSLGHDNKAAFRLRVHFHYHTLPATT